MPGTPDKLCSMGIEKIHFKIYNKAENGWFVSMIILFGQKYLYCFMTVNKMSKFWIQVPVRNNYEVI
jgi:hypothetical protein